MTEPEQDPRIGSILAERYEILEKLSAGAMGVVYRAERLQLGRIVAIKFLHSAFAFSSDFKKRFELEARTMSRLEHPHCVSVIDYGVADAPFIVMDYVTGPTLKTLLEAGAVPPLRALSITRQILAGLAHAHEKGIIHRDVKPANIMLTQATGTGDHVRILDFGLAKLVDTESSMSSAVVGTPLYMSPEQAVGKKVDARTDVYSTAVVLFELLTGDKLFQAADALQLIRKHVEEPPPALRDRRPAGRFSAELEAVLARGLAKSPADRFQTPEELAAALAATPEAEPAPRARSGPGRLHPTTGLGIGRASTVPTGATAAERMATRPGEPRPAPQRSWIAWVLAASVVVGGGVAWNAAGRPGLPQRGTDEAAQITPAAATTLADAKRLIASGERDRALSLLHDLWRQQPEQAEIPFLIGGLYFEKEGFRAEAIAAYREAVEASARYKQNPTLNRHLIDSLGDEATRDKARAVIVNRIGAAALPHLRTAARTGRTQAIRQQAAEIVKQLEAAR